MNFLPININISQKKVLIVGGGNVATHKARILSRFTTNVTVVATEISPEIKALGYEWKEKEIEKQDLAGYAIVFICTGDHMLNATVKQWAEEVNALASVCDNVPLCDFTSPAIERRENLTIAVASDAQDVKRSIRIRNRIKELIDTGVLSTE